MRLHTGETPYSCEICDAKFHLNEKLKEHVQFHDAPKISFICETCGKEYTRKTELNEHSKIHFGEPQFSCDICDKTFYTKKNYLGLLNIHNKTYECNECKKCFDSVRNLQRHEKAHQGIKDFQCEICAKPYTSTRSLLQHMEIKHQITHGKKQTFGCDHCTKSFTRNEFLQRHLSRHHSLVSPDDDNEGL